jgi:hypothetical protein
MSVFDTHTELFLAFSNIELITPQNYAVQHSRKPWKGSRQVLAALWDDDGRLGDFPEGLKLLQGVPRVPIIET